jgi:hypothetical protein
MSAARIPVSANIAKPPTLEELRAKLAQLEMDAQRAELQRRLANAASEHDAEAA